MRRFDVRWVPLMIAAGAFVGSALVSSVAVANDEPPPIDQPELVIEPAAEAPPPPNPTPADPSPTVEGGVDTVDVGQAAVDAVAGETTDPPFDDIAVVEMVLPETETMVETDPMVETDEPDNETGVETDQPDTGIDTNEPDTNAAAAESADPALAEPTDDATTPSESTAPVGALAVEMPPVVEEPDEGHEGSGGQGNPYRMTFTVIWLDPSGEPIAELDAVFLTIDWRSMFELTAASETGKGMPTSATCTYPVGSQVLQCVFDNPGHGSGTEGLVVPARPTATYTVTVAWPSPPDWTVENANDGPYYARDLCPREGDGSGGGHEGGGGHESGGTEEEGGGHESGGSPGGTEEEGGGHESGGSPGGTEEEGGGHESGGGGGGRGVSCEHIVVLRQKGSAIVPPVVPPVVEPEPEALPPVQAPTAPVVQPVAQPLPPAAAPTATEPVGAVASAAPRSLPTTGSSISTIILIAALLIVIGSVAAVLPRRTSAR